MKEAVFFLKRHVSAKLMGSFQSGKLILKDAQQFTHLFGTSFVGDVEQNVSNVA